MPRALSLGLGGCAVDQTVWRAFRSAIDALLSARGTLPVSSITSATCRLHVADSGVAAGDRRRELACLQAAPNHCERDGYLISPPKITLPPKDRWLTEEKAARQLWAARGTPHLDRFILLGLHTGTRKRARLALR